MERSGTDRKGKVTVTYEKPKPKRKERTIIDETVKPENRLCKCCNKSFLALYLKAHMILYWDERERTMPWRHICKEKGFIEFCDSCREKMRLLSWFYYHRKDPTPKDLQKGLRGFLKKYQGLLDA